MSAASRPGVRSLAAVALTLGLLAVPSFRGLAQSPAALSAADRIAIRQLVARYAYAMDDGTGDGAVLAGLFLPDGVLVTPDETVAGRERLAAFVRARGRLPSTATLVTNVVVSGAGDRAAGRAYVLEVAADGAPDASASASGGLFLDEYVRTPDGWRFARREFAPSRLPPGR